MNVRKDPGLHSMLTAQREIIIHSHKTMPTATHVKIQQEISLLTDKVWGCYASEMQSHNITQPTIQYVTHMREGYLCHFSRD